MENREEEYNMYDLSLEEYINEEQAVEMIIFESSRLSRESGTIFNSERLREVKESSLNLFTSLVRLEPNIQSSVLELEKMFFDVQLGEGEVRELPNLLRSVKQFFGQVSEICPSLRFLEENDRLEDYIKEIEEEEEIETEDSE